MKREFVLFSDDVEFATFGGYHDISFEPQVGEIITLYRSEYDEPTPKPARQHMVKAEVLRRHLIVEWREYPHQQDSRIESLNLHVDVIEATGRPKETLEKIHG